MRGSEVLRSLVAGCAVYLSALACSSAGGRDDRGTMAGGGGVTGMNGNAGSSSGGVDGTGAVAMAATGGDVGSGTCDCPAPELDQFFERPCDQSANNFQWATLSVPGASIDDLMTVSARFFSDNGDPVNGFTGAQSAMATAMAFNDGEVKAQCVGVARFRVPAALADKVTQ